MRTRSLVASAFLFLLLPAFIAGAEARDLTFEERVKAQEAIERVYYSYQLGATRSFEEAVPRALLEAKVRAYLERSAALDNVWHTPITAQMLERELQRMVSGTRMPDRLRQLFGALGNDVFMAQECLARPALAERLVGNFYAGDRALHAGERAAADALRARLASGSLDPKLPSPGRSVAEIVVAGSPASKSASPSAIEMPAAEFARMTSRLPRKSGGVGSVEELSDSFVIRTVLSESAGKVRLAVFSVRKKSRDEWWRQVEGGLSIASVRAVARDKGEFPVASAPAAPLFKVPGASCTDDIWDNGSLGRVSPLPRYATAAVWTGSLMMVYGGSYAGYPWPDGVRYDPATDTWSAMAIAPADPEQGVPFEKLGHTAVWTGDKMIIWGGFSYDYVNSKNVTSGSGAMYDPVGDSWTTLSPSTLSPRAHHTAVWDATHGVMIVWGGGGRSDDTHPDTKPLGDGASYSPATDTWAPLASDGAPTPRAFHTAVIAGGSMVVWGGNDEYVEIKVCSGNNQTTCSTDADCGADDQCAGVRVVGWSNDLGTGARFNLADGTWSPTFVEDPPDTPEPRAPAPIARRNHTAVAVGNKMIVWGGRRGADPGVALGSGSTYDPTTDTWEPTDLSGAPAARYRHSAVSTGDKMIVWGGFDGTIFRNGGAVFDPATGAWTATSLTGAPAARGDQTAVWTGSLMVVWGGTDDSTGADASNTGGRYDLASDSWTPTDFGPRPRYQLTAVWTGRDVFAWGGTDDYVNLDTGGRYDPAIDNFVSVPQGGAPQGRRQHTAVWSGDYVIVWGGWGYDPETNLDGPLRDGRRFDELAGSWLPMSTTGVPAKRWGHTAAWLTWQQGAGTAGRMVVWGGLNLTAEGVVYALADGARYDPIGNAWEPVASSGAPSARFEHTAVSTGPKMVVWGGDDGSAGEGNAGTKLDTGGVYDAATNAWSGVASSGAPSARSRHAAVWTGTRMLVFGGATAGNAPDGTGASYDPGSGGSGSWAALPGSGAPSPRFWHTAVWSGREMLVWGGNDGSSDLDTGARFDPALDQWLSMSATGVPLARSRHAAVWTGNLMFVWGGTNFGVPLGTGGRYLIDQNLDSDGDGYSPCQGDCNDGNPNVHPGATETCNAIDDNCDGQIDEGLTVPTWYRDADGDGYGSSTDLVQQCVAPLPYYVCNVSFLVRCNDDRDCPTGEACNRAVGFIPVDGDCNDRDYFIHPGVTEVCNGIDDDCNDQIDEGLAQGTFYPDVDGDQYGNAAKAVTGCRPLNFKVCRENPLVECSVDSDCPGTDRCERTVTWLTRGEDCNDYNISIRPGAAEICNQLDDDCDGQIDEGIPVVTAYRDADGDSFGDDGITIQTCLPRRGWASTACDCNDTDASIHPGATETCNGLDEDCDGLADGSKTCALSPSTHCRTDEDCPAPACRDNRCTQDQSVCTTDAECPQLDTCSQAEMLPTGDWYRDADGDGWGVPDGQVSGVCQPSKVCSGSFDLTCRADIDCPSGQTCQDFTVCSGDPSKLCKTSADCESAGSCNRKGDYAPRKYDSDGTPLDDCNDFNGGMNPGLVDNTCDRVDDDCSGLVDDGFNTCGNGVCAATSKACKAPGFKGQCSTTSTQLCNTDTDCRGKMCNVAKGASCSVDEDCPAGSCSDNPATACAKNSDCAEGASCKYGEQVCRYGFCSAAEVDPCDLNADCPTGTCSNNPSTPCHLDLECSGGTCLGAQKCLTRSTCSESREVCTGDDQCRPGRCSLLGNSCLDGSDCYPYETCVRETCNGSESCSIAQCTPVPGQGYQAGTETRCDGLDNNCDGAVDEALRGCEFPDSDGDGIGAISDSCNPLAPLSSTCACGAAPETGVCAVPAIQCLTESECRSGEACDTTLEVCVVPAVSCQVDNDCRSDEKCDAQSRICVRVPEVSCLSDSGCRRGQKCDSTRKVCILQETQCQQDTECESGEKCDADRKICVSAQGIPCQTDSECRTDERCDSVTKLCTFLVIPCQSGGDCPVDGKCDVNKDICVPALDFPCQTESDCRVDEKCDTQRMACIAETISCQVNNNCRSGETCLDGTCRVPCQVNEACRSDETCAGSESAVAGDNCPCVANPDQADRDGDGVGDACDNCPDLLNSSQSDYNGNHVGDACEAPVSTADIDGSGRVDGLDLSRLGRAWASLSTITTCLPPYRISDPAFDSTVDFNQDGRVDGDDLAFLATYFGQDVTPAAAASSRAR